MCLALIKEEKTHIKTHAIDITTYANKLAENLKGSANTSEESFKITKLTIVNSRHEASNENSDE